MKGCAFKPEQVEALIRNDHETLAMCIMLMTMSLAASRETPVRTH